jgi:hypothetical protein
MLKYNINDIREFVKNDIRFIDWGGYWWEFQKTG